MLNGLFSMYGGAFGVSVFIYVFFFSMLFAFENPPLLQVLLSVCPVSSCFFSPLFLRHFGLSFQVISFLPLLLASEILLRVLHPQGLIRHTRQV